LINVLDVDKNGKLSLDELTSVLPEPRFAKKIEELFRKHDVNQDGEVDVKELRKWLEAEYKRE
uniref:EF-hand domain-containing protein n=1 Tax=Echinostoma caproni TaxID=27848 RepID=A0A183AHU2_9TREM